MTTFDTLWRYQLHKKIIVMNHCTVPFSTFCAWTGLKRAANSFCSFNFFSFSNFLLSSFRGWSPPVFTCFSTCWMNFCCFAPFLFFSPNVLSWKWKIYYRKLKIFNKWLLTSITFSFFFCSVFLLGAPGFALGGILKNL